MGINLMPTVNAASFTHRFVYTNTDNNENAILNADITFEDGVSAAQNNTSGSSTAIDRSFITAITFNYTPTPGGTTYTITGTEITEYRLSLVNQGSTVYDGDPALLGQLNNIQFGTFSGGGSFGLTMNNGTGSEFSLQADQGGENNDFNLTSVTQFPAPLPLLGIIPAFTSIHRLKKRYNSIVKR